MDPCSPSLIEVSVCHPGLARSDVLVRGSASQTTAAYRSRRPPFKVIWHSPYTIRDTSFKTAS